MGKIPRCAGAGASCPPELALKLASSLGIALQHFKAANFMGKSAHATPDRETGKIRAGGHHFGAQAYLGSFCRGYWEYGQT